MKRKTLGVLALGMIMGTLMLGCTKFPEETVNSAKAAVEAVMAEGGEKYAKEELKLVNDELTSAMDEVATQQGKLMKNYDKANEMMAQVITKAEALKAEIPARKETVRTEALAAVESARAAVESARSLLAHAPKGKGTTADIEALTTDIAGLDEEMNETATLMTSEDYITASEKAVSIKEKAAELSAQISQAMEKVQLSKKKKK